MINLYKKDIGQYLRSRFLWPHWHGKWILGRHACLGRDIYQLLDCSLPIFNVQKGRVDQILSVFRDNPNTSNTAMFECHLRREDILPLIRQQEYIKNLPLHPPKLVYMDSFSELVDQKFTHRDENWAVCCCYDDVNHSHDFLKKFENKGLLGTKDLLFYYRSFFRELVIKYGEVPIFFIHFPTALETREKFTRRANAIRSAIEQLRHEFNNLYSFNLDEYEVQHAPIEPGIQTFPYHYDAGTYEAFATLLNSALHEIEKK